MKILFVGDDSIGIDAVAVAISGLGAKFANVEDIEKAIDFLNSETVHLVILDWDSPGVEGFNILRWIRTYRGSQPFVLLLTREILETELLRAFETGADDYVMKPLRRLELAARINALLRRIVSTADNKRHLQLGHYTVDFNRRLVYLRGQPITLTEKEFRLATILFNNVGKIVSRESIAKAVWGPTYNDFCRSMDTHVSRIRRKLALRAENGVRVKSVYTHGYTLTLSEPVSEKAEHTGDTERNT